MNDDVWLDDEEMCIWRAFLESSNRVLVALGEALKTDAGLTLDDYEVLVHLSAEPDRRLRMTDLSERLRNSPSRLTQRIDRLTKLDLVCREKCPEDRRGTFACLTDYGMETMKKIAPDHVREVRTHLIDLIAPEDRATVARVLETIVAGPAAMETAV